MKLRILFLLLVGGCAAAPAAAQVKLELDHLAARARESVNVSLDASTLRAAGSFLSTRKEGEAKAKELISNLKGIYVRAFEFDKENEYTQADLQSVRSQLQTPAWSRIVHAQERGGKEGAEVFLRSDGERPSGIVVIAYEPRQLAVVAIDGPIDLEQLAGLAGHFGIPTINIPGAAKREGKQ